MKVGILPLHVDIPFLAVSGENELKVIPRGEEAGPERGLYQARMS